MPSPFPGMDPYLEHPALWPGVHQRFIGAYARRLDSSERTHTHTSGRGCRVGRTGAARLWAALVKPSSLQMHRGSWSTPLPRVSETPIRYPRTPTLGPRHLQV